MTNEVTIDELDMKIIKILQSNARTSFREIARSLGTSPQTISNRVERLRKKGIIMGFTMLTDPSKLGKGLLAFFEVNVKPGHIEAVARAVSELREIVLVYETIGPHDLILYGIFGDHTKLAMFIDEKLGKIENVEKITTDICFRRM